jgi:hypothetical protein
LGSVVKLYDNIRLIDQTRSKSADNNVQRLKQGKTTVYVLNNVDFGLIGGDSKCMIIVGLRVGFGKVGALTNADTSACPNERK